jgi:aminoglycoside 6'-N-acetyltransferase
MSGPYAFRAATAADLPLLRRWRESPPVERWWGAPELEAEAEKLDDPRVAMWIVEREGRPFAFAQDYSPHDWAPHPFSHLPPGARGVDFYIGERDMLDRGHGTAFLRAYRDGLFAVGAPAIGADPHPDNLRARRALEKAGFRLTAGPMETRWGRAVLMECLREAD